MNSPYIKTELTGTVLLECNQLDEDIYIHTKNNLIKAKQGKCHNDKGYIAEIYKLELVGEPIINPENFRSQAIQHTKFTCKLANAIPNSSMIVQIQKINRELISAINGPIKVIIPSSRINEDKFAFDINHNLQHKCANNKFKQIRENDFVIVDIVSRMFSNGDRSILSIGFLKEIALEDHIKQFYADAYVQETDLELVELE